MKIDTNAYESDSSSDINFAKIKKTKPSMYKKVENRSHDKRKTIQRGGSTKRMSFDNY